MGIKELEGQGLGGCIKKDQVKQYSEAKFIQAVRGTPNTVLKRETNKTDVR